MKVLFFSRGRGRGHAIPDMEIGRLLPGDWQVSFVSYGTGAATFASAGVACIDMGLPDANGTAETTVIAGRLIGNLNPDVVVAHEEFAALPAAKIFGKPTILITDFFTSPEMYSMRTLRYADCILFPGRRGVFPEPPDAAGRVTYVHPVLRPFAFRRRDRKRARTELGLPHGACVVSVLPGSWTEQAVPIYDQVVRSFDGQRANGARHLIWLAGPDRKIIQRRARGAKEITILDFDPQPDRIMVASDLAITKCNRATVTELASLGIRTLSIRHGTNPADEQAIASLRSNQMVPELTPGVLRKALRAPEPRPVRWSGPSCASALRQWIEDHFAVSQRGR